MSVSADVQLDVMSAGVQTKSDSSGENMLLDTEVRLIAYINAYLDTEVNLVTDAYSTEMEVSLEYQQKNLVKLLESVTDACSQKNNFEFEEFGGFQGGGRLESDAAGDCPDGRR